jgi:hypothetical protein
LIESRHIHLQRQYAPADGFNLCCQLTSGFHIPETERHISASMSKSQRNGAPQAAASASH